MISINGKFLTREINGQIRMAEEIIYELDKIVDKGQFEIVAPISKYKMEELKNIPVVRYGKGNPHIWEQTYFYFYLLKNKRLGMNFLNTHPVLKPDICFMHDVLFKAYPQLYKGAYGRIAQKYTLIMLYTAARFAKSIITISQFSKREIVKYYRVNQDKIHVIYAAWQHMERIKADEGIFVKFPQIKKKEYCLAVSGITPQKNFEWILKNAEFNPEQQYVIVGKREGTTLLLSENETSNVMFTGRLTDGEMKALMENCLVFIHPAIYEGFGMTPLEAMASGAKIIIANSSCLPEIYQKSAHYIQPYEYNVNIQKLVQQPIESNEKILDKYSWRKAAEKLYMEIMDKKDRYEKKDNKQVD